MANSANGIDFVHRLFVRPIVFLGTHIFSSIEFIVLMTTHSPSPLTAGFFCRNVHVLLHKFYDLCFKTLCKLYKFSIFTRYDVGKMWTKVQFNCYYSMESMPIFNPKFDEPFKLLLKLSWWIRWTIRITKEVAQSEDYEDRKDILQLTLDLMRSKLSVHENSNIGMRTKIL